MLILGAGLVSRPIVRYFLDQPGYRVTVATLYLDHAHALVENNHRGTAVEVDVADDAQVEPLVQGSDLVVSLVPYIFHPRVARFAIKHGIHMVTASYVAPEMRELDALAREKNVLILNEVGLDPGLDHMSAMRVIDEVHGSGGTVTAFESCTGGLPAPEAANNPWRYKFSWSPKGALLAGRQPARYLEGDSIREIPGPELFLHARDFEIQGIGTFEMYPNRDSLRYIETYGIGEVTEMLRGTIRYPGWCETMKAVVDLGLLSDQPRSWPRGATFADLTTSKLPPGKGGGPAERIAAHLGLASGHPILERLDWSGLLSDRPLATGRAAPLDLLAELFQQKMGYAPAERDMVVMQHRMEAGWPDGRREKKTSRLVAYGEPAGDSATSRTVSLPAAIAGRLILDGRLPMTGIHIPTERRIYQPILDELVELGIVFEEKSEPV